MNSTIPFNTIPFNPLTGTIYQGDNVGRLISASECREWATFLQWKEAGHKIKKGEHGTTIFTFIPSEEKNKEGKIVSSTIARAYTLFNRTQVEKI